MRGDADNSMPSKSRFDWLQREISKVKTQEFFIVDGPTPTRDRHESERFIGLPESYKEFVADFGNAKLYKQVGGYALGVNAMPAEFHTDDGQLLLCIGHYLEKRAFFRNDQLHAGQDAPIYEGIPGRLHQVSDGFEEWLRGRSAQTRKSFGTERWSRVVCGSPPFTQADEAIVRARRNFGWDVVEVDLEHSVKFLVTNNSTLALPFLSIGVRHADGGFGGRIWLPVANVVPGCTATIQHDAYRKYIPREKLQAFDLPDPTPDTRDEYWEFKQLPRM